MTAARINVANSTVSATVDGTSATRTSMVGNLDDGRTSQYTMPSSSTAPVSISIRTVA